VNKTKDKPLLNVVSDLRRFASAHVSGRFLWPTVGSKAEAPSRGSRSKSAILFQCI